MSTNEGRWLSLALISCASLSLQVTCAGKPKVCLSYDQTPAAAQAAYLTSLNPPDRVEVLICRVRQRPPDLSILELVASTGADVVPPLLASLEQASGDPVRYYLISTVRLVANHGTPVWSDRAAMAQLESAVRKTQAGSWKLRMEEEIRGIEALGRGR